MTKKKMARKSPQKPTPASPPALTVQDYVDELERRYILEKFEAEDFGRAVPSRKTCVAETIVGVTTYSDEISVAMLDKWLFILDKVADKTLSDYINASTENYVQAMLILNMAQTMRWLGWGTSIRGAWLNKRSSLDFWGSIEYGDECDTDCEFLYEAIKVFIANEASTAKPE